MTTICTCFFADDVAVGEAVGEAFADVRATGGGAVELSGVEPDSPGAGDSLLAEPDAPTAEGAGEE